MADAYPWTCPYCGRDATVRQGDYFGCSMELTADNADGMMRLAPVFIICPNLKCHRVTLTITLFAIELEWSGVKWLDKDIIKQWDLIPPSKAKAFPSYVPKPVLDDYNEACLICKDSPKASATLSRRCLQGIIRDFWNVKPGRLIDEIKQIKDKTDPLTWEAIDSVRKIGNIGAHMEEEIDVIVDVDPNEAELLIRLIEILIRDWYITRKERKNHLSQITDIAQAKEQAKQETNENA